jgi:hypothetical protein
MSDTDDSDYQVTGLDDIDRTLQGIDSTLNAIESTLDGLESTLDGIKSHLTPSTRNSSAAGFISVLFFTLLLSGWSGSKLDRFTDRMWYSVIDQTKWSDVHIARRPSDCDFLHSPLGEKGCRYKKETTIFGDNDRHALILAATNYEDSMAAAKRPNSVFVYWDKRDEP